MMCENINYKYIIKKMIDRHMKMMYLNWEDSEHLESNTIATQKQYKEQTSQNKIQIICKSLIQGSVHYMSM